MIRDKCGPPDGSERTLAILAGGVKWWAKTAKQEGDGISKSSIPGTRYSLLGKKKHVRYARPNLGAVPLSDVGMALRLEKGCEVI